MAVKDLIEILTWQRGANTKSEEEFVQLHIASIPGIQRDGYGNYHLLVGDENPRVLWSCHTDTVTRFSGRQNVRWVDNNTLGLHNGRPGQCLGADDGGGVWLALEMIKENKPGYYVFHREEECGGIGSTFLKNNPDYFPKSIELAIAMDRAGTQDVITHQGFERCCSQDFAIALAAQLGMGFRPDDTGIFTDTANYTGLFGECTNLSIGYERNHGPMETLDVAFLQRLRDQLLELDVSKLPTVRQPGEFEYADYSNYGSFSGHGGGGYRPYNSKVDHGYSNDDGCSDYDDDLPWRDDKVNYSDIVRQHPDIAARLLEELGVEAAEFRAHVFAFTGQLYDV